MGMTDAIDLTPQEKKLITDLIQCYLSNTTVWAFGSRVKFTSRPDSDLDLVAFTKPDQQSQVSKLKEAFEESALPFRVDFLEWDAVPDNFKENIKKGYITTLVTNHSTKNKKEFTVYSFLDLLENIVDNRGKTCPVVLDSTQIPLIATNCIKNDSLYPEFENVRYVDEDTYKNWFRAHPHPGDILFVCKGSPGRVCWVPDPVNFCIAQDMLAIRGNSKVVYPKFLFALLRSDETQHKIQNMYVGTLIPHFKKGDFGNLYFNIPNDYNIQEIIGNLYFTLSEKIALNRATNQTLEQIAQTLFKSWFVDFDPVQAKARGENPIGMDDATAAFFPDSFEESELGLIPAGWKVKSLYEIADYLNGTSFREEDFTDDNSGLPIIKIAELKQGITNTTRYTIKEVDKKYLINNGDILYSWSGSPETSLDIFKWFGGEGWLNQHIFKVGFKSPEQEPFIYFLFQFLKPQLIEIAKHKQTTGLGHITIGDMKKLKIAFPDINTQSLFHKLTFPAYQNHSNILMESNYLASIRDSLLPKLLSGELAVEAEEENS